MGYSWGALMSAATHADTADTATTTQQLPDELHKPIIRKFQKHNIYLSFYGLVRLLILLICNKEADITVRYFAVY